MEDVDGNRYVDFDMGFGALFAGHMHPAVRAAVEAQLDDGTLFVTPCEVNADVAELLASATACRCGGSPTRAPKRRWTPSASPGASPAGKIVKVEGGYHGHHDEVMISMKPPLDEAGPADHPTRSRPPPASPKRSLADTIVIPYNDADALERVLAAGDVAAFIVEPVMENIGICLPEPGYLEAVREITATPRHAADLRRGEDRHHRRLGRRHRALRRAARPRRAGQVDRRRLSRRRVRRQGRVHGPDHHRARCSTSAPTTATRSCMAAAKAVLDRGLHARGHATRRSPATSGCSRPATR